MPIPTPPIVLTDEQMDCVLRAAAPLQPGDRAAFLEALPRCRRSPSLSLPS
jgi:hypothetical protein